MSRELKFRAWDTKFKVMLKGGDYWFPDVDNKTKWHDNKCWPIIVTSAGILCQKKIVTDPCGWVDVHNAKGHLTSYYANWEELRLTSEGLIIEQFTGLKDRHGREIYEGDIVNDGFVTKAVIWRDDGWQLQRHYQFEEDGEKHEGDNFGRISMWVTEPNALEVIGNIHENPELLQ